MFAVKDNKTVLGEQMIDLGSDVNQRNKVRGFITHFL